MTNLNDIDNHDNNKKLIDNEINETEIETDKSIKENNTETEQEKEEQKKEEEEKKQQQIIKIKNLLNIKNQISKLNQSQYNEIYKIIETNNENYSKNKNGVMFDLLKLQDKTINKIESFINYIQNNNELFETNEIIKNNLKNNIN